jgi:hypothetical protein
MHHEDMRTTLNLEDDVLREVKRYADSRSVPLGKAVSDLVRRGLSTPVQTRVVNGIQVVVLPSDAASVSSEKVKRLLEDEVE